jgi:Kef-type K+ transport system membrane component KefB
MAGKIMGSLSAKLFTRLSLKQLYLVGWGMNSRGAVELAIAFLALQAGLVSVNVYSSLIIMALATTIIFPFIFRRMVKKDPEIMGGFSKCKHEIKKKY